MTAQYVKLAPALQDRQIADIAGGSLWSISGIEVKEYPEPQRAADFARDMFRQGRLVEATQAEFDAYTAMCEDTVNFVKEMRENKVTGHQETELIGFAREGESQLVGLLNGEEVERGEDEPTFQGKNRDQLLNIDGGKEALIALAEEEGVDSSGTKADIVDRLLDV